MRNRTPKLVARAAVVLALACGSCPVALAAGTNPDASQDAARAILDATGVPPVSLGGFTRGFRPQRLVTDGKRVYLPIGEKAVLTALDAATGTTLKTLDGAQGTTKIFCDGGVLRAYSSAGGKTLWEHKLDAPPVFDGLIAAADRLFLCTTARLSAWLPRNDVVAHAFHGCLLFPSPP